MIDFLVDVVFGEVERWWEWGSEVWVGLGWEGLSGNLGG